MNINEALSLLRQVCAKYKGTLEEHTILQQALKTVLDKCSELQQLLGIDKVPEEKDESPPETPESK